MLGQHLKQFSRVQAIAKTLIEGGQFPFRLLRCEIDATREYWDEWWRLYDEKAGIVRPEPVSNNDPILTKTIQLSTADTVTHRVLFSECLETWISSGDLKSSTSYDRSEFQEAIATLISERGTASEGSPVVFFMGGGYGSGKSSSISTMLAWGLPSALKGLRSVFGVDGCKLAIPEYNCLITVRDGRASETCQEESRKISDLVFSKLIAKKATFAWDSSMSNSAPTWEKLRACRAAGYHIVLVGVITDKEVARKRAMKRAFHILRFPPPSHFDSSHEGFLKHCDSYWDFCDSGLLLRNSAEYQEPKRIKEKNMKIFGF